MGTAGAGATGETITDLEAIATGRHDLVGKRVDPANVRVAGRADAGGFFTETDGRKLLVLPAATEQVKVSEGESVRIEGAILQMPRAMQRKLGPQGSMNEDIYVLATAVNPNRR